jgi:hypothetical protein
MEARYVKTEAGRAEMKERRLALPRHARLLLVIIDASKGGADWVAAVNGSSEADIERLLAEGLIEPHGGAARPAAAAAAAPGSAAASTSASASTSAPAAASGAASASTPAAASPIPREPTKPSPNMPALSDTALAELVQSLSYRQLYDLLTAQARPRLGLISGYRMVLEVERCNGADEVRALALRFVESVRQAQGAEGVRQFCVELRALAPSAP